MTLCNIRSMCSIDNEGNAVLGLHKRGTEFEVRKSLSAGAAAPAFTTGCWHGTLLSFPSWSDSPVKCFNVGDDRGCRLFF